MSDLRPSFEAGRQVAFDNTSLSRYKECPKKYYFSIVQGYRQKSEPPTLKFGGDFHLCVEEYDHGIVSGLSHDQALVASVRLALELTTSYADDGSPSFWLGDGKYRTRATLLRAVIWYCETYQSDPLQTLVLPDGRPAIELSFRLELPNSSFLYCGHIDKIATYGSHGVFIQERKTTASSIGSYYFDQYNPNSQLSGYVLAGTALSSTPVIGAVIDAIQLAVDFARPARSIQFRPKDLLDEWLADTLTWIERIEESFSANSWPMNTESCHKYGGCQFRSVCSKSPSIRPMLLEADFTIVPWDPLKIRGKGVEET
jgi:hypothetical protein